MEKTEQLQNIMNAQADLLEALVETLSGTQQALIHSDTTALEACTRREEELLRPFHDLEFERERCVAELGEGRLSMRDLMPRLPEQDRPVLEALAGRMRKSAEHLVELNSQNRMLIKNAQRFADETLKILTDDNRRKLIDERM